MVLSDSALTHRVVVTAVNDGSAASHVIAAGDAILAINGEEPMGAREASLRITQAAGTLVLTIRPGGAKAARQLMAGSARRLDASPMARVLLAVVVAYGLMLLGGLMLYHAEHAAERASACAERETENELRVSMRLPRLEDQGCPRPWEVTG